MTHPTTFPPHHYPVQLRGGPLDGRILPLYDKTFEHPGWRHGVPSKQETSNGGIIWSYAHRWPVGCPRYVVTVDGDAIVADWRPITDAEYNDGAHEEARWRHWEKVLHPLEYVADAALHARQRAEQRGVTDPKELYRVAAAAVEAIRAGERHALGTWVAGERISDGVQYVCNIRGNLQVRLHKGRQQWFQPAADRYAAYPDRHVWIPPIRNTSALLARGPLTLVAHDLITPEDRVKLDALRDLALQHAVTVDA